MIVSEAVATRRTVRAFLDKPVDQAVLRRVLEKAQSAPSGGNTQPWNATVVTGEPLAKLLADVAAILPEDRDRMQAAVRTSIESRSDYDIEYRICTPAGDVRWIQVRGQPFYDPAGNPLSMAGVTLDVTERKRGEEHRALLAEELNHRVKNSMATIQSIAHQTLTHATSLAEARTAAGIVGQRAADLTELARQRGFSAWESDPRVAPLVVEIDSAIAGGTALPLRTLRCHARSGDDELSAAPAGTCRAGRRSVRCLAHPQRAAAGAGREFTVPVRPRAVARNARTIVRAGAG